MKYLYLLLFIPFVLIGQHNCITVSPKGAVKEALELELRRAASIRSNTRTTNSGTTCIPIKVHDVLNGANGGGVDRTALNRSIANLNYYFKPAGIEFYICGISTLNDGTYYDLAPTTEEGPLTTADPPVTNAFNMYLVNSIVGASGFAYYPANSLTSTTSFINKTIIDSYPNGTVVHEFGHLFFLYHTHEDTEKGASDPDAENVPRSGVNSNCTDHGDNLCDTHADPRGTYSGCSYTDTLTDINGEFYTPSLDNIMSYYPDACGGVKFTDGQYGRIMAALTSRQSHSAYTLNCPATSVTAASNLAATLNGNQVDLSWTDNANNELGYLIERSETSSSTGFESVVNGGVADGATGFTDYSVESNKTYYYRIKASNGNCNTYSNVATVSLGLIYCMPNYSNYCSGSIISNVTLNGNTSFNNSSLLGDCDMNTSYKDYSQTVSANVTAGNSFTMSVSKTGSNSRYIQIYADFNIDGDFEDLDEKLLEDNVTMGSTYTTNTISVPVTAHNGTGRIRVVLKNTSGTIANACDNIGYGETEDYALNISGGITGTAASLAVDQALKMIPNPSSGKTELNVWSGEDAVGIIRITSIQGNLQQVIERPVLYGDNSIELDLGGLQSGVYMVETIIGKTSRIGKLFKY